ncbi:MAG: hypothetical protein ACXVC6_11365 [Bacteroidia bacterium]
MKIKLAILSLIALFFGSCKKAGCNDSIAENYCSDCNKVDNSHCVYGTFYHIFWFNKSTSDSLLAHGVDTLVMQSPTGDPHVPYNYFIFPVTSFCNNTPPCQKGNNVMWLQAESKVGRPSSINYDVFSYHNHTKSNIPSSNSSWSGNANFFSQCSSTQLVW